MSQRIVIADYARRAAWYVFLAPLVAALPAAPVLGQLDEIIVTTEFREANVQDTPIAITAVNAAMLEARSQTNLAQITAQAPNVSLRAAGSSFGNALVAYIRGIGQTDFNPSVEPGVGIYVDDVYYSTITGNVLDLLDLDRVEVLRGPQGTLAGRNAIGGAIKLFTRKADGVDDADVGLTIGDFDRTEIRGAAGMTLIPDKLYARVAGVARTSDGYVTRLDYACAKSLPRPGTPGGLPTYAPSFGCELGKEGGQSYAAGRMNLRWVAGEEGNFEMNIAASFVNDDSQSQPGVLVAAKDNSGSAFPILSPTLAGSFTPNPYFNPTSAGFVPSFYDNNGNGTYQANIDIPYDSRFVTGGTYTNYATYINDGNSTPIDIFQGGVPGQNMDVYKPYVVEPINHLNSSDVSINLDWQISDNTSLLWVSSMREYKNEFAEDTDGSPIAVQQLLQVMDHEQTTHEIRLNTSFGNADFTIGAFYLDQETAEDARVDLPYVGFDFIHGPDLVPATNQAIYAHLALHFGDRTDLTFGVRQSEDEKSYTFRRRNPDLTPVQPCADIPGFPGVYNPFFWEGTNPANCGVFGVDLLSVAYSSDNTDYRAALSRDIGDATMVYVQYSTGYKAGGNNARPFFPSQLNAFKPETLDSIEVGMKSTLGGNSRLNMAVFSNQYSDIQLPSNVCTWAPANQQTPCASQNNVGDADVMGFEIEAEWHPGDRATIDASYSMLDFEYTRIAPNATSVTLGMITPYTPENKFSFGAQYEFQAGRGTLTPRIDASFQDDVFSNATNGPMNLIESYTLVNARLTWRSMDDDWRVALEATNLTDEYYYVTLFDLWGPVGYVHGQPGRPAEYALSINRSF